MIKAMIKTAGSFDNADIDRIKTGFEKLLGEPLEFEVTQDISLLGGFVAYIDGRVYDASVALQLKNIRSSFSEKAGG